MSRALVVVFLCGFFLSSGEVVAIQYCSKHQRHFDKDNGEECPVCRDLKSGRSTDPSGLNDHNVEAMDQDEDCTPSVESLAELMATRRMIRDVRQDSQHHALSPYNMVIGVGVQASHLLSGHVMQRGSTDQQFLYDTFGAASASPSPEPAPDFDQLLYEEEHELQERVKAALGSMAVENLSALDDPPANFQSLIRQMAQTATQSTHETLSLALQYVGLTGNLAQDLHPESTILIHMYWGSASTILIMNPQGESVQTFIGLVDGWFMLNVLRPAIVELIQSVEYYAPSLRFRAWSDRQTAHACYPQKR
ncbi:MAG: hypothetical protein ACR2PT_14700 [Endozoicomonas sp.]